MEQRSTLTHLFPMHSFQWVEKGCFVNEWVKKARKFSLNALLMKKQNYSPGTQTLLRKHGRFPRM